MRKEGSPSYAGRCNGTRTQAYGRMAGTRSMSGASLFTYATCCHRSSSASCPPARLPPSPAFARRRCRPPPAEGRKRHSHAQTQVMPCCTSLARSLKIRQWAGWGREYTGRQGPLVGRGWGGSPSLHVTTRAQKAPSSRPGMSGMWQTGGGSTMPQQCSSPPPGTARE